ncbi:MAG: hypothetical protein QOK43_1678 [Acidimicrobiaceae bacterium]|nr:hypothetical protein [Acidimicrobiaceae bacterium]
MTVPEAERDRVIAVLREQAAEGRLDMDEFGQRLDEAYQAASAEQLQHALRELPVEPVMAPLSSPPRRTDSPRPTRGPAQRTTRGPAALRHGGPQRHRHPATTRDKKATVARVAWKTHLHTYIWVNLMLVLIWAMTSPGGYFWPMWPMMGWGIGLVAHGTAYVSGKDRGRHDR